MFHSSSSVPRRPNFDGTVNLYCSTCGEFVSKASIRMRVQCELCRRVEAGEPMTAEAIEFYQQSKQPPTDDIRLLVLPSESPVKEPKRFNLSSMGGNLLEAVGLKKKKKVTVSQKVSKAQRRGRIFDNVQLGTIQQVDEDLKRNE